MDIDFKLIGERIKEERKNKGLTQDDLAEKIKVSIAYLSRVERGHPVNLRRLAQISKELGVDIGFFISGIEPGSKFYLDKDLNDILEKCTPEKKLLIYKIAKIILDSKVV